jgi:hypothetical protein
MLNASGVSRVIRIEAQERSAQALESVKRLLMLHSIGVGNILPASVRHRLRRHQQSSPSSPTAARR